MKVMKRNGTEVIFDITKIIAAGMAAAVCLCLCTVAFSGPIAAAAGETGVSMAHNYYLYEEDGVLSMIPWDYNLAFGGFLGGSDATSVVNDPIDSPASSGSTEDRPMVAWIFQEETYTQQYHALYDQFITTYFERVYRWRRLRCTSCFRNADRAGRVRRV